MSVDFLITYSPNTHESQIGPYSPTTLSRCPLPPKLRASNLVLDEDLYNDMYVFFFFFLQLLSHYATETTLLIIISKTHAGDRPPPTRTLTNYCESRRLPQP